MHLWGYAYATQDAHLLNFSLMVLTIYVSGSRSFNKTQNLSPFHQKCCLFGYKLSNGYSRANFASARTRQNGRFQKYARLARLADIRQAFLWELARLADIRQAVLRWLARLANTLANTRQAVLRGLARLAKSEFGESGEFG